MYVFPDDDSKRVETCWRYYDLNLKHKLAPTYCAVGWCL